MDNGVDDDDDDDIEAEIRRQLDALTESDLELEDDADWTTSLRDLAGLDNGLEDVNDQNVDSSVHLPESMVFYLSTIKGCHDDRIETELQDCNEALERTNIHSNLTDNLMERMKNELGDQFSEEEILMSRQAIEDLEKQEEAAFMQKTDSSCCDSIQEMDEFEGLRELTQKQQQMEEKRRAENERRRQEMKEVELKIERERKRKEEEWKEEQQRLEEQQKIALEKLNENLEKERRKLEKERIKHEAEMAQFVAEQQQCQQELQQLKAIEAERLEEVNTKAAVCIQRIYRGYSVRKWIKPLLSQKKLERLKRQEEEQRKQLERKAEEQRQREEQERLRKQEADRRRREKEERRRKEEEERKRKEEEERKQKQEEERKRIEEEKRQEEKRIRDEERRRREETERRKQEEEDRKKREEEERRQQMEEERRKRLEEEARQREEEERKRKQEEEEKKKREEQEHQRVAELEKHRLEEERRMREEQERQQLEQKRKQMEEELKRSPQYVAAARIQAVWRGHVTRVVLWDWLPWLQRREEERRQRNDAAVKIQALCRGVLLRKHLDEALLAARFEDEVDDFDYDQEIDLSLFNFDQTQLDEGWGPAPSPQLPPRGPPLAAIATQSDSNVLSQKLDSRRYTPPVNPRVAWGRNSRTSNNPSRLSSGLSCSTPDVSTGHVVRSPSEPVAVLTSLLPHPPGLERQQKDVELSEKVGKTSISHEWGFKNNETAKMMLKRARRLKQNVLSRKKFQDPQKRLELFRKLDPLSTVARPPKRVERTSYFSKQAHDLSSGEASPSFDNRKQQQADLTFKWVHEHFVSHPDSRFVQQSHSKTSMRSRDANSGKSSSLSDQLHLQQSFLHMPPDMTTKMVTPHFLTDHPTQTQRRHSETNTDRDVRLPAIKVNSAPVRKTWNRIEHQ